MPMIETLRGLLLEDANEAIDLAEDEKILFVTGRHWIVLLTRLIVPVLGIALFGGVAAYRAAGGGFIVSNTGEPSGFDWFNILLVIVEVVLGLSWIALWVRRSKDRRARNALLLANALILLLIYFRYNGGRIFYINPAQFFDQSLDTLNIALIIFAVICLLFCFFTFYDWLNDELILTNKRVVYDNDQVFIPRLLEQRVQEQIFIDEIQNASFKTNTYPQHWLNYGTIDVKSARIGGNITFASANKPGEMHKRIMEQLNSLRKQRSNQDYTNMIEARVYNNKPPKSPHKIELRRTKFIRQIGWLFIENPQVNEDSGSITWHPHWLFLLRSMLGPILLLCVGWLMVIILSNVILFGPVIFILAMVVVLIAFMAWTAWEIEDYRNDRYILTPTNVIDINKKPFGPEDRQDASLGNINNVSFKTTFVSNLLGYGDVVLETAGGGSKFTFDRVPRPRDVVAQVNEYYLAFKRGEKEKTLNDTLDLLRYYHEAQQRHQELNVPPSTP